MTPPTYSPWLKAFEILAKLGFGPTHPSGSPGPIGDANESVDCDGDLAWKKLASPRSLYDAWAPPATSPWSGYARPTLFAALGNALDVRPDAAPKLETRSAFQHKPRLAEGTAVILDLPGPQSVALAAWLARADGYQPVVLFNNWPHPKGVVPMSATLGALLYYAPWVTLDHDLRGSAGPPVFVLDRNRLGRLPNVSEFDNRYYHLDADFPSPASLKRAGIQRILYVAPQGQAVTPMAPDQPSLTGAPAWAPPGSDVPPGFSAGPTAATSLAPALPVAPAPAPADMDDVNPYLRDARKTLGLGLALAPPDAWSLGTPSDFAPPQRKTPFNTSKDPAFAGFRRASAGGFGKLIPEPSSGGGYG